jgi:hypothetical protein
MNFKVAVLATAMLSSSTMFAGTITVDLGQSNQNYTLIGTGGSNGYGTYSVEQGACVAGASETTCTLSGAYTGLTPGYLSGTYSLITTYANGEGLDAISSDPVSSPDGGNYFVLEPPFASDVEMTLDLDDSGGMTTVPMVVNGTFVDDSFIVSAVDSVCSGLPAGVPCTQGNVGLNSGSSIFSPVTGSVTFNTDIARAPAPVPEPGWLILGGLPAALLMLRRRVVPTV